MRWSELPKEYQSIIIGCDYEDIDILEERFEWDMTKQGFDFWEKCHLAKTIDELPPLPEKEFILPEKWCVKSHECSDIHKWFEKKLGREVIFYGNSYYHYPEIEIGLCVDDMINWGYTEITYEQWVKYVRDTDTKFYGGLNYIDSVVNDKESCKLDKTQKALDQVHKTITNTLSTLIKLRKESDLRNKRDKMDGFRLTGKEEISESKENPFQKQYAYCRHTLQGISQGGMDVPLSNQETLDPFYMIYVDGASGSTRKHDYESACKEAHRLSKETDKKVFILRSVEYFERNIEIKKTIILI